MKKWDSPFLKQLQLLPWSISEFRLVPVKKFNIAELFVGDTHKTDIAILRQKRFDTLFMNLGILHTGAMTDIDGKLKHRESVF